MVLSLFGNKAAMCAHTQVAELSKKRKSDGPYLMTPEKPTPKLPNPIPNLQLQQSQSKFLKIRDITKIFV